jgi:hypothetical protein
MFFMKKLFLIAAICLIGEVFAADVCVKEHKTILQSGDYRNYKNWMLSLHPSPGKEALLMSTSLAAHYPVTTAITWYKACISREKFAALLQQHYVPSSITIATIPGNYDYSPDGAFWVDFANAQHFGGSFRTTGNVQEERMFDEFPQLANLAYSLRDKKTILPVNERGEAEPFLINSLMRLFDVSKAPYGRDVDVASPEDVQKSIVQLDKPFSKAHIIGLAAIDYNKNHEGANHSSKYTKCDLEYLLQAAFLGDIAALQHNTQQTLCIHTGRWGAGAFKNSLKMVTAIQILAAEMALKDLSASLFFHGVDDSLLAPIRQEIDQKLSSGMTPLAILNHLCMYQDTDPSWRPQE